MRGHRKSFGFIAIIDWNIFLVLIVDWTLLKLLQLCMFIYVYIFGLYGQCMDPMNNGHIM